MKKFVFILTFILCIASTNISIEAARFIRYTVVNDPSDPNLIDKYNILTDGGFEGNEGSIHPIKNASYDNTQAIEGSRSLRIDPSLDEGIANGNITIDLYEDEALKLTFYVKAENLLPNSDVKLSVGMNKNGEEVENYALFDYSTPGLAEGKWVKCEAYYLYGEIPESDFNLTFYRSPAVNLIENPDANLDEYPCPTYWIDNVSVTYMHVPPPTIKPTISFANTNLTEKTKSIRGSTAAGAKITFSVANKKYTLTADNNGKWSRKISKLKVGTKVSVVAKLNSFYSDPLTKTVVPSAATIKKITKKSKRISGKVGFANVKVTVMVGGKKYRTVADKNKNYSVKVKAPKKGTTVTVTYLYKKMISVKASRKVK